MNEEQLKTFNKVSIYPEPKESFSFSLAAISEVKNDALIILDANVLLLPFTIDSKNLDAIGRVYRRLVENDKIFIPSQAIREYLDNRASKLTDINATLEKKQNQSFQFVDGYPLLENLDKYLELKDLEQNLQEILKKYKAQIGEVLKTIKNWGWNDPVSDLYQKILHERVLSDEHINLEEIQKDLRRRNTLKLPPGYKDGNKDENAAGDLIIWHEILQLAKFKHQHVIFVSGDEKADWWHKSNKKALYPRYELVDEFRQHTDGMSFHIVSLSKLLELFETDKEVVESVKSSENIAKLQTNSAEELDSDNRFISFDPDCEFREHLKIPTSLGLNINHMKRQVKDGFDTDTYLIRVQRHDGTVVANYNYFDRTKTTPPFNREINWEKLDEPLN